MSLFGSVFRALLPLAPAWLLDAAPISDFFEGLTSAPQAARDHLAQVGLNLLPSETEKLAEWEQQFGLAPGNLTEAERRVRLDLAWSAGGGLSPRRIQDVLQANGFHVFVHEYFAPFNDSSTSVAVAVEEHDSAGPPGGLDVLAQPGVIGNNAGESVVVVRFNLDVPADAVVRNAYIKVTTDIFGAAEAGTVGFGILQDDTLWTSPAAFNAYPLPVDDKLFPAVDGAVIPGRMQNDRFVDTYEHLGFANSDVWYFGTASAIQGFPLRAVLPNLAADINQWIASPSYAQGGPIGFVLDALGTMTAQPWRISLFSGGAPPELVIEWEVRTSPTVGSGAARNPTTVLTGDGQQVRLSVCGEAFMQCGNTQVAPLPDAMAGETDGTRGYQLVNKIATTVTTHIGAGDPELQCGNTFTAADGFGRSAQCGEILDIVDGFIQHSIPTDADEQRSFVYVGGDTFPNHAIVDASRREAFEDLLLQIMPGHLYIGVLVDYSKGTRGPRPELRGLTK